MQRCFWAGEDPAMIDYHDCEWGVPLHDDRALFEFLVLEGAQAVLIWETILKKRSRVTRRASILVANTTTGASRRYKPLLVLKRGKK